MVMAGKALSLWLTTWVEMKVGSSLNCTRHWTTWITRPTNRVDREAQYTRACKILSLFTLWFLTSTTS